MRLLRRGGPGRRDAWLSSDEGASLVEFAMLVPFLILLLLGINPGEPGRFSGGGNPTMIQLSGIILPDSALPNVMRGNPPPGGG